jgi:hypothetical protein
MKRVISGKWGGTQCGMEPDIANTLICRGEWHGIFGIPKILNKRKPINKHTQIEIRRLHKGLNSNGC